MSKTLIVNFKILRFEFEVLQYYYTRTESYVYRQIRLHLLLIKDVLKPCGLMHLA